MRTFNKTFYYFYQNLLESTNFASFATIPVCAKYLLNMEMTTRDVSLKRAEDNQTDACLGEKSVQTKGGKEFHNEETDFEMENKTLSSLVEGTSLASSCIKTKPALLSIKAMN